jgi:hypothetical protein
MIERILAAQFLQKVDRRSVSDWESPAIEFPRIKRP